MGMYMRDFFYTWLSEVGTTTLNGWHCLEAWTLHGRNVQNSKLRINKHACICFLSALDCG